ncbi:hypothetical protein D1BOALGB6SA_3090 [Olavius sp. associated proteobacterium Delta 1]|nr:hypothetical protein D1BOALGB6SA_3090 [Olavius sp. associated proteobacterium Delta 1]
MKPIYFPFTYISDPVAEALSACFGQFIVYRPMSENLTEQLQLWINRGVADVRVPVTGNENELITAVKNYQAWADLHRDSSRGKAAILKSPRDPMPFFNELSIHKIIENIKENIPVSSRSQIPDPVLTARIFLYFAQELDRQNRELTDDLNHHHQQEADLIRQLKMEEDPVAVEFRKAPTILPDPFADYMISDRLEAWTRIFCRDPEVPGLFVTHSAAVLDHLLDRATTAARVMHLESIPISKHKNAERESWQEGLALNLVRLVEQNQIDTDGESMEPLGLPAAENTVSMSVYRVPDQTPYEFFARSVEIDWPVADGVDYKSKFSSTLIALIQGSFN